MGYALQNKASVEPVESVESTELSETLRRKQWASNVYKVYALLPRTNAEIVIFEDNDFNKVRKYCTYNIKYFPKLTLAQGWKRSGEYIEVFTNNEFVDRYRDYVRPVKINKIKRKTAFEHRIIYEDDVKVLFMVKYKNSGARICIIDRSNKDAVFSLLRTSRDYFRIKIHKKVLPIVYFRHNARRHSNIFEIVFNIKRFKYMNFKDGNPYNYMKSNVFFTKSSPSAKSRRPSSGYYGVIYYPKEQGRKKYIVKLTVNNKIKKVGRFSDPLIAAKYYDSARIEAYGKSASKNFPYEYYAAFEPHYLNRFKKAQSENSCKDKQ